MVSIGDVGLLRSQRRDDVTQSRQGLVDGLRLLQLLACTERLLYPAHTAAVLVSESAPANSLQMLSGCTVHCCALGWCAMTD